MCTSVSLKIWCHSFEVKSQGEDGEFGSISGIAMMEKCHF